ncbi:MAG: nucleotide exchange factor GrpE [Candidimonas sp.]|nr:MAG: nucleotide exchange factor GrpE [Candidimonas sp.]
MSSPNEPLDPRRGGRPVDTSEKLEVNDEHDDGAGAGSQDGPASQPAPGGAFAGGAAGVRSGEPSEPGQAPEPEDLASLLASAQAEVAKYRDQLLRAQAEVENTRRRGQEEAAKARKFGTEAFAQGLVPVKDSLEAALAQTEQSMQSWREGVETTLRQLNAAFERNLLKEIAPASGDKFDPHSHQAISSIPSDLPEGAVVDMLQKGYTIADRVLRPALVTVSSGQAGQ